MKLQIKKFNTYSDKTGSLMPFYLNSHLNNFKLKRFFFIYGNTKYPRADHAHKKCDQILIPICGEVIIKIIKKNKKKTSFNISRKNKKYLLVPRHHWIKIIFKSKDSILLTLCNYKYDKKEYISVLNNFLKKNF